MADCALGGRLRFVTVVGQPVVFLYVPMQGFIEQGFAIGDHTTVLDTTWERVFLSNSCKLVRILSRSDAFSFPSVRGSGPYP